MRGESGLLLVDKPEGPTSHDVTALVRRLTGVGRVGHTGTLDPFASGLLLLCLGWTTRLAEYVTALPKAYRGVVRLGASTDTDDRTGAVISKDEGWRSLESRQVSQALEAQLGEIEQLPPAYSARKVNGKRAYAVARQGGEPGLRARRVTINRLDLIGYRPPDVELEIECSSGTYVRAVARDLGVALGVGGYLVQLRRTRIGQFGVGDAISIERSMPRDAILDRLRPPAEAVSHLGRADLDRGCAEPLRHGQPVDWSARAPDGPLAVFEAGRLVAIAEKRQSRLWPKKVFSAAGA